MIEGGVEPLGDREVVVHLDRVFRVEAEVEPLAQKGDEVAAELRARPAHAEGVPLRQADR